MNPRQVILAVTLASSGAFIAGQTVQAQVDKSTVYKPASLRNSVQAFHVTFEEAFRPLMLDGGFDPDGGWQDGGWSGFYERTLTDNMTLEVRGALMPAVPFMERAPCNPSIRVSRADGGFRALEREIRRLAVPLQAAQCYVNQTDGGE